MSDADLRAMVDRDVFDHVLHVNPDNVLATVEHGVVLLTGRLEYEGDITTAVRLIASIPGVVEVTNRLDYTWNGDSPLAKAAVVPL